MIRHERVSVCRESLFKLTGSFAAAIVLNQFLFWAKCKADADAMYAKEIKAYENENGKLDFKPTYGWIYKSAEELAEETMLGISRTNIRRIVKQLVEKGYILERRNPNYSWDRTYQYNVNFEQIQHDLLKIGYSLPGYTLGRRVEIDDFDDDDVQDVKSNENTGTIECADLDNRMCEPEQSNVQNATFKRAKLNIQMSQNERAIPEITTEITKEDKRESIRESKQENTLTQKRIDIDCFNVDAVTTEQAAEREKYFDKFWKTYPRRANKLKARIAWQCLPVDVGLYEKILQSVGLYKLSQQWQDANYIPYPETFLNNEKWEDDIPTGEVKEEMPF